MHVWVARFRNEALLAMCTACFKIYFRITARGKLMFPQLFEIFPLSYSIAGVKRVSSETIH